MENTSTQTEKPHRIHIPKYTLGEEITNAIIHGIGAGLGIAALVLCIVKAAFTGDAMSVTAVSIYGSSLVLLYIVSTLYHSFKVNTAKRVFRVLDHCMINLLIAGTYTPYTLITLRGALGWVFFGIVWAGAALSIVLNAVDIKKFRVFSFICYIAMGWCIIAAIVPLINSLGYMGSFFLIAGGVVYTLGCIFYAIGKKKRYMHSVFHIFVLAGSILQFFSIFFYVIV